MAQTFDIGPYFVHFIRLQPGSPHVHRAPTQEIEEPYRTSNSLVVRFVSSLGLVFGRWQHSGKTEDEALLSAIGHETDLEPLIEKWDDDVRA